MAIFDQRRNMSDILESQKAYYNARAAEYERSLCYNDGGFGGENPDSESLTKIQQFVRTVPFIESTIELACGTGIWTQEFLATSRTLHAVDASPAMIALNRVHNEDMVTFECADVFHWTPSHRFDRVAVAFFLSHVPNELLPAFVATTDRLTTAEGTLLIIDEAIAAADNGCRTELRELSDGSIFEIVKIYRGVGEMRAAFQSCYRQVRLRFVLGRFFAMLLSK
jgi:ubiquinone/menaquinone biosynthesis C-methylase UbiE